MVDKLANLLPHSGRGFLSRATSALDKKCTRDSKVGVFGEGFHASFAMLNSGEGPYPSDWFIDETCIPFGQIETFKFEGPDYPEDFPHQPYECKNAPSGPAEASRQ